MIPNEVATNHRIFRSFLFLADCKPPFSLSGTSLILLTLVFCTLTPAQETKPKEFDLIHHGDIVDVDVVGGSEFDWRGRLTPEGVLDGLNSFGDPIPGLCRSEEEVAADVRRAYSKFLRDPVVVVRVIDRSGRPVAILDGAVKLPQKFQLNRPATLRELVVLSGGILDDASGDIQIFRPAGLDCSAREAKGDRRESNSLSVVNITIKDLISGEPAADPLIRSGDIITVRRADVIYLIGGVANPHQISSRTSTTLTRAIATAGGIAKQGDPSSVTIYRRQDQVTERIEVDLKKVESGEASDPPLRAFDIVEISVKGAEKRKFPPIATKELPVRNSMPLRIVD